MFNNSIVGKISNKLNFSIKYKVPELIEADIGKILSDESWVQKPTDILCKEIRFNYEGKTIKLIFFLSFELSSFKKLDYLLSNLEEKRNPLKKVFKVIMTYTFQFLFGMFFVYIIYNAEMSSPSNINMWNYIWNVGVFICGTFCYTSLKFMIDLIRGRESREFI